MHSYIIHEQITTPYSGQISNSLFEFFQSDKGAAIQISYSDYTLSVTSSLFRFCIVSYSGGAIYFQGKDTLIDHTCFDSCCIYVAHDDYFGNAIYGELYASTDGSVSMKMLGLFACGPREHIASDSTALFSKLQFESENTNFSQCSGIGGPSSTAVLNKAGKTKFMSVYGGRNYMMASGSTVPLSLEKVNFINWTQTSSDNAFYGVHMDITDCCIFVTMKGGIGDVTFSGNCYSNLNSGKLTQTATTEIGLPINKADEYCVNEKSSGKRANHIAQILGLPLMDCEGTFESFKVNKKKS